MLQMLGPVGPESIGVEPIGIPVDLRVPADQVLSEDRWECPGKGGSTGTPPPGHGVGGSGGFSMEVDMDGNVTAYCEPGPPGNV